MKQRPTELRVGGLTRLSTCDWPGQLVATVFCQGCAWDCAYCHNPGLRPARTPAQGPGCVPWAKVLGFLSGRRGLLDAVVFSGGEPTLQPALLEAVAEVRRLGFLVGLHTAGMNPETLEQLLGSIEWVGFDVKAPFADYARVTGVRHSGARALASLRSLLSSGVEYEVRTTWHPDLLSLEDLCRLKEELRSLGVAHYVLQRYRSQGARPRLPAISEFPSLFAGSGDFQRFEIR